MPVITLEDDIRITTFRPPSGFDPLSATAAELEQYGLPARPEHPRLLKLYQRVFTRLKGRLKYVEPSFRIIRENPRNPSSGVFTGDNWSGGVVQPPPGQSFRQVLGHWVVPNSYPVAERLFFNSYWIGLDGFSEPGANEVLQAGVDCLLVGNLRPSFYPWHQWAPSPKVAISNLEISAGDLVMVSITASPGAGATTATVQFANISSGAATSFAVSATPPTRLTGNSAEWIVEADDVNQLADYGQLFFADCIACAGNNTGAGGGTGQKLDILRGTTAISEATLVTPQVI